MSGIEQQQKPSTMLEWSPAVLVATLLILALAAARPAATHRSCQTAR